MRGAQITTLPLSERDRAAFIKLANVTFEEIFASIEPQSPEETRRLWDAGKFVDGFLREDMLPISSDYAITLIEPFLVPHVANLAAQADKNMGVPALSMDELNGAFAGDGKPGLRCSLDIINETGNTSEDLRATTAEALRLLATHIETARVTNGVHPLKTPDGHIIGEFYLEQYEAITAPNGFTLARSAKG